MVDFTLIAVINIENFPKFSIARFYEKELRLPRVGEEITIGEKHKTSVVVTKVTQNPENNINLVHCSGGLDLFKSTVQDNNHWKFFSGSAGSYQTLLLTNS